MKLFRVKEFEFLTDPIKGVAKISTLNGLSYDLNQSIRLLDALDHVVWGIDPKVKGGLVKSGLDIELSAIKRLVKSGSVVFEHNGVIDTSDDIVEDYCRFIMASNSLKKEAVIDITGIEGNENTTLRYVDFEHGRFSDFQRDANYSTAWVEVVEMGIISICWINGVVDFFNKDWELCWYYSFEGRGPLQLYQTVSIDLEKEIILNLSMNKKGFQTTGGVLIKLCKETGNVQWQRTFKNQIDGLVRKDSYYTYVLSGTVLFEIENNSGKDISSLEIGLPDRILNSYFFEFEGVGLVGDKLNRRLYVIDLVNLEVLKKIELAPLGLELSNSQPVVVDGLIYLQFTVTGFQSAICAATKEQLLTEWEIEPLPNFQIETPSEGYGPVVINIDDQSIGYIVRHLDYLLVELAERLGNEGRGLGHSKCFNGTFEVHCENIDSEGFELDQCFGLLKRSIESTAAQWGMRSGKGDRPIEVEFFYEISV